VLQAQDRLVVDLFAGLAEEPNPHDGADGCELDWVRHDQPVVGADVAPPSAGRV
jgi:hypothetical protein